MSALTPRLLQPGGLEIVRYRPIAVQQQSFCSPPEFTGRQLTAGVDPSTPFKAPGSYAQERTFLADRRLSCRGRVSSHLHEMSSGPSPC